MKCRSVGAFLLAVSSVSGCAHQRVKPPPSEHTVLGPLTLDSRDYAHVNACDLAPQPLAGETERVDGFLSRYLDMTSAGREGHWSAEQLRVLRDSRTRVPKIAKNIQKVLADLNACPPDEALGFGELRRQGTELARQALLRVDEAAGILAFVRARRDLEAWRQVQAREKATARESLCPHPPRAAAKVPPIYYAAEDETQETSFFFCDDVQVTRSAARPTASVKLPSEHPRKGAAKEGAYLTAASTFEASQVRHAPRLPGTGSAPASDAAPEPEPDF